MLDLDGLHLQAEVLDDGWYYRISKSGKGTVKDWTPAPAPSASKYEELEDVKFEAVVSALGILHKSDDPHEVFSTVVWRPYDPEASP